MKMIILGAGATAHSYYANPDRRPPLSSTGDLLRMFKNPVIIRPAVETHYKPFFIEAVALYNGDIESLFTGLYLLENSESFKQEMAKISEITALKNLCSKLGGINDSTTYSNILTIFSGVLFDEIRSCIGTRGGVPMMLNEMPICPWHRMIARKLNVGDVVVNFNYDSTMPYALLNEKKLSKKSFLNKHIDIVDIEAHLQSDNPVVLLTPHGSFTWWQDITLKNYWDGQQFHCTEEFLKVANKVKQYHQKGVPIPKGLLSSLNSRLNPISITIGLNHFPPKGNNTLSRLILPLKKKKYVLDNLPHLGDEYRLFLDKLKIADEVYLIGKQFMSTDQDVAEDIKNVCQQSNQKCMIYVNPDSDNPAWIEHHNDIFNAKSHICFDGLENYITRFATR